MIRYIDIDDTICSTIDCNYESAMPIGTRIRLINKWYDQGDTIVYYTARGASRSVEEKEIIVKLTRIQLARWGCKYHELNFDKPLYDVMYDNRAFNSEILDALKVHI